MTSILNFTGTTSLEFWTGGGICVLSLVVLVLALLPEREYARVPRGVFPQVPAAKETRRARIDRAPMRSAPPEMTPAIADFIIDGATGDSATVSTLVDLACRGYIAFDFIRDPGVRGETIVVSLQKDPDASLPPQERRFLEAIAEPGAGESRHYRAEHPLDIARYRTGMEAAGLPPSRQPILRVQGFSRTLAHTVATDVRHEVMKRRRWFLPGRELLGSLGAVELIGGALWCFIAIISTLALAVTPFWIGVSLVVAIAGLVTVLKYKSRSPGGIVASDQIYGFRRFLVDAPPTTGARLDDFVRYAGWAYALNCLDEWTQSLESLSRTDTRTIDTLVPWLVTPGEDLHSWYQVRDYITMIGLRLHGHPASDDSARRSRGEQAVAPAGETPVKSR